MQTTIVLEGKELQMWTIMKAMDGIGVFDIRFGSATIHFDGQGKVSNIEVKRNYRVQEFELST